jgi:serine/threonine protein phosphatase 1
MKSRGVEVTSHLSGRAVRVIETTPSRLFAIGDIHGCLSELDVLLAYLEQERALSGKDQVVFMGDFIDRGPASKGVLARLITFREKFPATVFLRGNHEDMLLSYLGLGGFGGDIYLDNGGLQTIESYGWSAELSPLELLPLFPADQREFLLGLEVGVQLAEFLFVHAGVRPSVPLANQSGHDLMWIRSEFTKGTHDLGLTVVFGHTPYEDVFVHLPYKIGVDTGLVYGNMLTCIELVEGELLQVDFADSSVKVASLRDRLGSRSR